MTPNQEQKLTIVFCGIVMILLLIIPFTLLLDSAREIPIVDPAGSRWASEPVYGFQASPTNTVQVYRDVLAAAQPRRLKALAIDVTIPKARRVIPLLIAYAEGGETLRLGYIDGGQLDAFLTTWIRGQPEVTDQGLKINFGMQWKDEDIEYCTQEMPFLNTEMAQACKGEWVDLGHLQVKLDQLIPHFKKTATGCDAVWENPPEFYFRLGWLRSWSFKLNVIHITPEHGTFDISGVPDAILPRLIWGE